VTVEQRRAIRRAVQEKQLTLKRPLTDDERRQTIAHALAPERRRQPVAEHLHHGR